MTGLSALASFLAVASVPSIRATAHKLIREDAQTYATAEAPKIADSLYSKFGIRMSVPLIKSGDLREKEGASGLYEDSTNTIFYDNHLRPVFNSKLDKLLLDSTRLTDDNLREVLIHEMTHAYTDHLSKQLTGKKWPKTDDLQGGLEGMGSNFSKAYARRMISEGISEYITTQFYPQHMNRLGKSWHEGELFLVNRFEAFFGPGDNRRTPYLGGYEIVRPILDKFGVKEGISLIIQNTPDIGWLPYLSEWRDSVVASAPKYTNKIK